MRASAAILNWRGGWRFLLGAAAAAAIGSGVVGGCGHLVADRSDEQTLQDLAKEPLTVSPWRFGTRTGAAISTPHYRVYTTIEDPLYQRLLARLVEASFTRSANFGGHSRVNGPLECYVFATRGQWETYTRVKAGNNAPVYLAISAGGYCQDGVFTGYDIGREQTLSVVSHEAWHQYAFFAFKDRLPAWLDEGMATQNESIDWQGTTPVFKPELNYRRWKGLSDAIRERRMWTIEELASTHAGKVIKLTQKQVDAYYAELWSFVLFLQNSPQYRAGLSRMLADAHDGKLTDSLKGAGVSRVEIEKFTERWNSVAGPLYLKKYITSDLGKLQREYDAFARELASGWPPKVQKTQKDGN